MCVPPSGSSSTLFPCKVRNSSQFAIDGKRGNSYRKMSRGLMRTADVVTLHGDCLVHMYEVWMDVLTSAKTMSTERVTADVRLSYGNSGLPLPVPFPFLLLLSIPAAESGVSADPLRGQRRKPVMKIYDAVSPVVQQTRRRNWFSRRAPHTDVEQQQQQQRAKRYDRRVRCAAVFIVYSTLRRTATYWLIASPAACCLLNLFSHEHRDSGRALVSGRIGVLYVLKVARYGQKSMVGRIDTPRKMKPSVNVRRKNVSAYSVGISQYVRRKSSIFEMHVFNYALSVNFICFNHC